MGAKIPSKIPYCNSQVLLKVKALAGNYLQLLGNNNCF